MASLWRVPVVWDGLTGLPGVSVFHGAAGGSAVADIKTFFNDIKALFPAGLTWQIPTEGDVIDDATGTLTGGWSDVAGGTVSSTGSGIWASGTGMYVTWGTGTIVNGRRLKGRTFLCPLFGSAFQTDGTIVNAYVSTVQTAANLLVAGLDLKIWHRPSTPGGSDGSSATVTSAQAQDKVTSLRSRRT